MATVAGSKRLLDISGNNISTAVSLTASGTLLDTNGAAGASNQVLSSTGSGVDWVNASSVIGGPYLPLTGGTLSGPGDLTVNGDVVLGGSAQSPKTITIQQIGVTTTDTNAVMQDGNGVLKIRTLGTGAFGPTPVGAYLPLTGGTLTGDTNLTGSTKKLILKSGAQLGFEDATPTGTIYLYNDGAAVSRLNIGGTMWVEETGNVGIGTTSPSQKLDVNGYARATGGFVGSSGLKLFGDNSSTNFAFVSTGGNVGIGTTSPSQKLHVSGNARVTGAYYDSNNSPGTSGQVLSSTATGTDWVSAGGTSGFAPMVKFNRSGINSSTYTMIATVNGDRLASVLKMTMTGTSNSVVFACAFDITVNHSQDIHVKSSNGDYTEVTLRITSDGNEDFSIEAKHNGSTTTEAEVCIFPLANEIITPTTTDPGYTGPEYEHTATEGWRYGGVDNSVESSNVIVDGKIGIGTSSPGQKLDVAGNLRGNNVYINDSVVPSLYMERGDGLPQPVIQLVKSNDNLLIGNTAIDEVIFYDDAGEAMRLDGSGNLGIGTTSPGAKLEVSSTDNVAAIINSTNTFTFLDLENDGTNRVQIGNASDGNFIIRTSDTERVRVNSSGNVGIGTTSPGQLLHVSGNARVDGDFFIIESNPQIFLSDTNHNSDFSINLNGDTTNSVEYLL